MYNLSQDKHSFILLFEFTRPMFRYYSYKACETYVPYQNQEHHEINPLAS